jgi:hypothetical protein
MPFTMCHEVAHRLGIASEREANFAAFLACTASDDVRFVYAGDYSAFCYCFNALYRADPERAQQRACQRICTCGIDQCRDAGKHGGVECQRGTEQKQRGDEPYGHCQRGAQLA